MPPIVFTVLQGLTAAINAAPQVAALVNKAKEFISAMTAAKLISIEQQRALHERVDAICAAALAGQEPPHWQVQPDPEESES